MKCLKTKITNLESQTSVIRQSHIHRNQKRGSLYPESVLMENWCTRMEFNLNIRRELKLHKNSFKVYTPLCYLEELMEKQLLIKSFPLKILL